VDAAPATAQRRAPRPPAWLVGAAPVAVLAAAIAVFLALGAPGLERIGVPQEKLAVVRTVLSPGEIELRVRNDGADPVRIRQVVVNDGFAAFGQSTTRIGRLATDKVTIHYPWIEAQDYDITLITATGATIEHQVAAATDTPATDLGFYGLMALIGLYVGVIPVAIGMLWLPWVRRIDARWIQFLLALTLGLLVFIGVDAVLEGVDFAAGGAQALGGPLLVILGALLSYVMLAGIGNQLNAKQRRLSNARSAAPGVRLAFLVALGIGLHNLGEGLAIGSAYAIGSLALGATLVVGFALHNTTEGLAIVAPVANEHAGKTATIRLALLGMLAGAPAIVGAWIGGSAFDPSLAAFLFGLGAGAIAQVVVQIAPSVRDGQGRLLHPLAVGGMVSGLALMYTTSLLVSV
jgi:zinc transporter, ZIP family